MHNYIISFLIVLFSFVLCNERTFKLKSGNKVTGEIINIDENGNYTVSTSMGEVVFNQGEIIMENVKIITADGDHIIGILKNEDNNNFHIKTDIGLMSIHKNNINSIDFKYEDLDDEGFLNNLNKSEKRFYYGDEQLIDIWFDPTGNVLSEGTIYISGLSGAYGVTNKLQLSLRLWDYLFGNINIRPKYQIYKKSDLEKSSALSIGAHLYLTGSVPHKWQFIKECNNGESTCPNNRSTASYWEPINAYDVKGPSYELFLAYTSSKLKSSDQGRINYNLGASIAKVDGYSESMPRIWFGIDLDVRRSLKLTALVAYDSYIPTLAELIEGEDLTDIHLDFGFIYALNNNFRLGLHLTSPFIGFYWKF